MPVSCYYLALAGVRGNRRWWARRRQTRNNLWDKEDLISPRIFHFGVGREATSSTYLPSLSNGLKTYPGLPGTNFPVGNAVDGADAREDETLVDECAASLRDMPEVSLDASVLAALGLNLQLFAGLTPSLAGLIGRDS